MIKGTKYKTSASIHIGYHEDEFPALYQIKKICIINKDVSKIMFIVSELQSVQFCEHYQCYEVSNPVRRHLKVTYWKDFTSHLPLSQIKIGLNKKYICMRYEVECPS